MIRLNKASIIVLLLGISISTLIYYQRYKLCQTHKFKQVSNEVFKYRVNINTASINELDNLPGIGPGMAKRIINHRKQNGPFKNINDLTQVKGIGSKKLSKIRPFLSS